MKFENDQEHMNTILKSPPLDDPSQNLVEAEHSDKYIDKQKLILEAAHHLISQKGIKHATITQIAKKAGVVDSVIYHYFKNKEDVVLSVLDRQLLKALEDLDFHFKGIIGPVSQLGKMIWYHMSMNDQGNTQMRKNLLLECRGFQNFTKHRSYTTLKKYIGIMDSILQRGVEEGFFSPDLNIPLTRTVILGLLDEEALLYTNTENSGNTLSDFDYIMDLVLGMTANPHLSDTSDEKPDKYRRILLSAKRLYAERGFKNATMADVAALAGVAEGTIYEYFKNKQDLLLSITKEYFGKLKAELDEAFTTTPNQSSDKLRWIMWHHFKIFGGDRDLVTVFLKDTKLKKFFYQTEAHKVFFENHHNNCDALEEGKKTGIYRPELETRVFRNLVMGSLAAVYTRWYYRTPVYALDYMTELNQYIELICRAATMPPDKINGHPIKL